MSQYATAGEKRVLFARPWYDLPENRRRLASWSKTLLHGKYDRALDITFSQEIPTGQCLQAVDRNTGQVVHRAVMINPNPTYVDRHGEPQPMFTNPTDQYRAAQALIAHEQGHAARTTRHEAEPGTALNDVLNMLEDERMERDLVKLGVPIGWLLHGRTGVFTGLGRRCWQIWREETDHSRRNAQLADGDLVPALLSAVLYARWGLRYGSREEFYHDAFDDNAAAIAVWENDIFPLVEQAWDADSTADAEDYARQIIAALRLPEQTSNGRIPENPFGACPEGRSAPREARVTLRRPATGNPKPGQTRIAGKPSKGDPTSKPEPANGKNAASGSETPKAEETEDGAGQPSAGEPEKPQGKTGKACKSNAGDKPGGEAGEGDSKGDQSGESPKDGQSGESSANESGDEGDEGDQSGEGSKDSQSAQQPGSESGDGNGDRDQSGQGSKGSQPGQQPGNESGDGDGDGDQAGQGSQGSQPGQQPGNESGDGDQAGQGSQGSQPGQQPGSESGDGDGDRDQAGQGSKRGQSGQPGNESGDGDGDGDQAGQGSQGSQSGQQPGNESGDGDGDRDRAGEDSQSGQSDQSGNESDESGSTSNSSDSSPTGEANENEYNEDDKGSDGMHVVDGEAPNTDIDEAHHGVGGYTETGDVSETPRPVEDTGPDEYDILSGLPEGDPSADPMYQPVQDEGFEGTYYEDPSHGLNPVDYRDIIADARRQVANPLIAVLAEPPQAIIQRRSSSRGHYNAMADLRTWGDKPQTFDMVSEGRGMTVDELVIDASGSNQMREAAIRLALLGYYLAAQECNIDVAVTVTGNNWEEKSSRFPHYQVLVEHGDDPEKAMCMLRGFHASFGTEWLYQGLTVRLERLKASRAPNRRLIVLTDAHLGVGGTSYRDGHATVHGQSADKNYTTDWGNCYQLLRQIPEEITVIPVLLRERSQVDPHEAFCLDLVRQLFPTRYPLLSCTIGSLPRALADALLGANSL